VSLKKWYKNLKLTVILVLVAGRGKEEELKLVLYQSYKTRPKRKKERKKIKKYCEKYEQIMCAKLYASCSHKKKRNMHQ